MSALEQIRVAIAAASTAKDPTMRIVYTATARALVTKLRTELEQVEGHVTAIEVEIGRTARDVTQLPKAQREP